MKLKRRQKAIDFSAESLPKNRLEVFFDCVKMRFGLFCLCGLVLLLSAMPLLAVYIIKDLYVNDIFLQLQNNIINQTQAVQQTNSVINLFNLLAIPCLAVISVVYAGVSRILRQLAWGEGIFFRHDLIRGIKDNWLNCLICFCLAGVVIFANAFVMSYVEKMGDSFTKYIPLGISCIVLLPVCMLVLSQTCVYDARFGEQCKNAFILYFKSLPSTLLAVMICFTPALYLLIKLLLVRVMVTVAVFVVILPLLIFAWQLYCFSLFDKHINKHAYPEIVDRGVYRKG